MRLRDEETYFLSTRCLAGAGACAGCCGVTEQLVPGASIMAITDYHSYHGYHGYFSVLTIVRNSDHAWSYLVTIIDQ